MPEKVRGKSFRILDVLVMTPVILVFLGLLSIPIIFYVSDTEVSFKYYFDCVTI